MKRVLLFLSFVALVVSSVSPLEAEEASGNKTASWIIKPTFEDALPFSSNGLAAVKWKGQWGFIGKDGKGVIQPRWEEVHSFHEKMAGMKVGEKWGFIDKEGKVLIEPKWVEVGPFSNGLARFREGDLWGFIDPMGTVVVKPEWQLGEKTKRQSQRTPKSFKHGMVAVFKNEKLGVLGTNGTLLAEAEWDRISEITEEGAGLFKHTGKSYGAAWGNDLRFIDRTGKVLFDAKTCGLKGKDFYSTGFSEGLAAIKFSTGIGERLLYLRPSGEIAFVLPGKTLSNPPHHSFSDGLAAVRTGRQAENLRFINQKGETAFKVEGKWEPLIPFSEGVAAIREFDFKKPKIERIVKLINHQGEILGTVEGKLFNTGYSGIRQVFTDGLLPVNGYHEVGYSSCGYLGSNGEWIIRPNPKLQFPGNFRTGLCRILVAYGKAPDGTWFNTQAIIDRSGKIVAAPMSANVERSKSDAHQPTLGTDANNVVDSALMSGEPICWQHPQTKKFGYLEFRDRDEKPDKE